MSSQATTGGRTRRPITWLLALGAWLMCGFWTQCGPRLDGWPDQDHLSICAHGKRTVPASRDDSKGACISGGAPPGHLGQLIAVHTGHQVQKKNRASWAVCRGNREQRTGPQAHLDRAGSGACWPPPSRLARPNGTRLRNLPAIKGHRCAAPPTRERRNTAGAAQNGKEGLARGGSHPATAGRWRLEGLAALGLERPNMRLGGQPVECVQERRPDGLAALGQERPNMRLGEQPVE